MGRDTTDQFSNAVQAELYKCIDTSANTVGLIGVSVTNGEKNLGGLSEKLLACIDKTNNKVRVTVL